MSVQTEKLERFTAQDLFAQLYIQLMPCCLCLSLLTMSNYASWD